MDYRKLGPSGTIVTAYCLGTMTFGAEADEAASHRLLDDYFAGAAISSIPPTSIAPANPRRSSAAG